jgi:hypothetical protein
MLELAMAAARNHDDPSVGFDQPDSVGDFGIPV